MTKNGANPLLMTELYLSSWYSKVLRQDYPGLLSFESVKDTREAFHHFDVEKVAQMTQEDIERLMQYDGIVKNRLKINSTINNAKLFIAIQKEYGSFYKYTLSFFPKQRAVVNNFKTLSQVPATSPESDAMSKDMRKRGFKFFGSTICYAFLQAAGFVNDHLEDCFCKAVR